MRRRVRKEGGSALRDPLETQAGTWRAEERPHELTGDTVTPSGPSTATVTVPVSPQVEPFASLAGAVRSSVPRVLINRELVGPFAWQQRHNDVAKLGDVVGGVEELVELLGWKDEMQTLIQKEKEKVGRGSKPQLSPSSAPAFPVLELSRGVGLCLLG